MSPKFNVTDLHQPGLTVSPMLAKTSVGLLSFLAKTFANIILFASGLVSEWLPSIARAHFREWLAHKRGSFAAAVGGLSSAKHKAMPKLSTNPANQ